MNPTIVLALIRAIGLVLAVAVGAGILGEVVYQVWTDRRSSIGRWHPRPDRKRRAF